MDLLALLAPGDLRTTGAVSEVVPLLVGDQALFDQVLDGLWSDAPGLRLRCADAIEKASRAAPRRLAPHQDRLLALLRTTDVAELQWHLLQMAPRLPLNPRERDACQGRARELLEGSASRIVRTEALQALVALAEQDHRSWPATRAAVLTALQDPAPAVRARARALSPRMP